MTTFGPDLELNHRLEGQKSKKPGARSLFFSPSILREPSSAAGAAADKAMMWQYIVVVKATPTVKTATSVATRAC